MRLKTNPLLASFRLLTIIGLSGIVYVAYLLRKLPVRDPAGRFEITSRWVRRWATWVGRISGVRVTAGCPPPAPPVLLCPNHFGYADILALAGTTGCFFVARADAAEWPLLGPLIRASEQVLVSRKKSRDLADTSEQIGQLLRAGQAVTVFLEGTSTGGDRLLPFYPALLKPASETGVAVVPVAMTWSTDQVGVSVSGDIAYWGEHNIVTHMWRFMGIGKKSAHIEFGSPRSATGRKRKELAAELRSEILKMKGFPVE